ncbi:hypothetical protein BGW36DRAFT_370303 [Talaromyces proteolyticus]|uniref:Uncharacterized protein n=1 Tax=Talaromyces proteolyticus TaxID=1131652 RepID=A0AAD4KYN0_9EURO|nr:uncharacterized protein BGW36DRAFT_370303 [Talaromyces proteolyticus]KAH8703960.1 hypothetical protein BGW36DRAFT_370303 [Talaromyces proteolyticus]
MSGSNPFRRSRIIAASEPIPSIPNHHDVTVPDVNKGVFDIPIASTKPHLPLHSKTVRIATPPLPSPPADSTTYFPAAPLTAPRTHHSPPPLEIGDGESSDDSTADPFNPHSSAGGGREEDYIQVVGGDYTTGPNAPDRQIVNESGLRRAMSEGGESHQRPDSAVEAKQKSNAMLDVDAFTRLLLTGNADGRGGEDKKVVTTRIDTVSDPVIQARFGSAAADSSDSSDVETVSVMRRGDLDSHATSNTSTSVHSLKAESNEIQRTASVKRPKPPPPRTRHGKPIKPGESSQTSRKSSEEIYLSGESTQQPTNPEMAISSPEAVSDATLPTSLSDTSINDDVSALQRAPSQSKRPPTPPLARRHSQRKPSMKKSARDHPHRISLPPKGLGLELPGPPSPGTKTPPRPPSRRHEKAGGSLAEAFSHTKSSLSQEHSAPSSTLGGEGPGSTASSSPPSRSPSIKWSTSGSASNAPSMPPPPPPPRRVRASSKSSLNSTQSSTLQSKSAEDNLSSSHAQDILADLSRLQQEVDNLRGHYESRKVSQ